MVKFLTGTVRKIEGIKFRFPTRVLSNIILLFPTC